MFSSKTDDPNSPSKCPYCIKEIGIDKNTYRFQVGDFPAGGDGNSQRSAGRVIAVSCSYCSKVLGFVNQ